MWHSKSGSKAWIMQLFIQKSPNYYFFQWVITECLCWGCRPGIVLGANNPHVNKTNEVLAVPGSWEFLGEGETHWATSIELDRGLQKCTKANLARKPQTDGCGCWSQKTSWIRWHLGSGLKNCGSTPWGYRGKNVPEHGCSKCKGAAGGLATQSGSVFMWPPLYSKIIVSNHVIIRNHHLFLNWSIVDLQY